MRPRLINKGNTKRTKGRNQAACIPAKDSAQDGDRQQNAGGASDPTVKVMAKQKSLELAEGGVHLLGGGAADQKVVGAIHLCAVQQSNDLPPL